MPTVPLSGTNIRLISGVPFSNDYKHTRWFDSESAQTAYFTGKTIVHSMATANFQRIEGKNFISVNDSTDALWGTNYIMFQNASYSAKWFYAFVTKLEYVQRNTTYVHFEIDVFQTWKFIMNFKPSYVAREHCQLWNSDGSPVINTVDEGLDYGSEYDVMEGTQYIPNDGIMFLVIVAKSSLHILDGYPAANYIKSSMNGSTQPLSIYIHPFNLFGATPEIVINDEGGGDTHYTPDSVSNLLTVLYSLETAVNNIVSLYITEHVGLNATLSGDTLMLNNIDGYQQLDYVNIATSPDTFNTIYVKNMLVYSNTEIECKLKYLDFGGVYSSGHWSFPTTESKLLLYPYAFSILDDFKGNRITLKNEYLADDMIAVDAIGSMGVSNKIAYVPQNYLNENVSSSITRTTIGIEHALIDRTPHDIPIITDMLASFIQGNRNSLQNQATTIAFNGIMGAIGNSIGGIASRNPIGMASSASNLVTGAGNSLLQLQGLQAKLKDIDNTPPSMAKMGGNMSFEYGNTYYGFWLVSKQIKPEYQKKLSDFFGMYGYKVNEVKIPNFHTRANWNFVQTVSCVILANMNNEDLQELKNVFDNGITLWHTDDVGNYALSNGVI